MTIIPNIDYGMLATALQQYQAHGYTYVEVPWMVPMPAIRATLPAEFPYWEAAIRFEYDEGRRDAFIESYGLVGSAEQSFLSMGLEPGRYVGVSPCFRHEPHLDICHQTTFMKIELFVSKLDRRTDTILSSVINDARRTMSIAGLCSPPELMETKDGYDLMMGGIEVGSYGMRSHPDFGPWVYGTGLALPRFSVAKAFASLG